MCGRAENYVDGLAITSRNKAGVRTVMWSYAVGASDSVTYTNKATRCGCPCTDYGKYVWRHESHT